jgi:hypothetical protein
MNFMSTKMRNTLFGAALSLLVLSGCGGGGASGTGGSGGGTGVQAATLSGTVYMPSTATVNNFSRDSEFLPVDGAQVELINVETGQVVDTAITDDQGEYTFDQGITDNTDFQVVATKRVNGEDWEVSAIVSVDDADAAPVTRDLDPVTTVAAEAAIEQYEAAKQADPEYKSEDLEDVCRDIEDRHRPGFISPDLGNKQEREEKRKEILDSVKPDGNYVGRFEGDGKGFVAATIKDGKFAIVGIGEHEFERAKDLTKFEDDGPGVSDGDNPGEGDENGGGDNGGGENGGDDNNGNDEEYSPIVFGTVDSSGVVVAQSADGDLVLSGIIVGDTGVGVWRSENNGQVEKGRWKITRKTFQYAGLYVGIDVEEEFDGEDTIVYVLVNNDGGMFIQGASEGGSHWFTGVGKVNEDGSFRMKFYDSEGTEGVAEGQIQDGIITGVGTDSNGRESEFTVDLKFDPSSGLQFENFSSK